jgi:hypothetical protein
MFGFSVFAIQTPNPDKPEKWPQRHKDTKQDCLIKPIFVFWYLGGENVLPQNVVDPPLEDTKIIHKIRQWAKSKE